MTYTDFTDRDTYLAARAAWRADYAALSQDIRSTKHQMRETQKAGGEASLLQMNRESKRKTARKMMRIRQEMKELSAQQREARLAEKAVA